MLTAKREGEVFFMSTSKHKQRVFGWNPPKLPKDARLPFDEPQNVASATECTGIARQPLQNESECIHTADLYATLPLKPQGNIGKGNPRNDPDEIHFHRE